MHVGQPNLTLIKGALRELRLIKGFSQEALCNDFYNNNVQVSLATVKRAESGKPISARVAKAIADYFSVELPTLISQGAYLPKREVKQVYMFVFLLRPVGFFSCDAQNRQSLFQYIYLWLSYADIKQVNIVGNYICGYSHSLSALDSVLRIFGAELIKGDWLKGHVMSCVVMSSSVNISSQSLELDASDLHGAEHLLQQQNKYGLFVDDEIQLKVINKHRFYPINDQNHSRMWGYLSKVNEAALVEGSEDLSLSHFKTLLNQSCFNNEEVFVIEGALGTGKSHLLRHIRQLLKTQMKGVLVEAIDLDTQFDGAILIQIIKALLKRLNQDQLIQHVLDIEPLYAEIVQYCISDHYLLHKEISTSHWLGLLECIFDFCQFQVLYLDDAEKSDQKSLQTLFNLVKKQKLRLVLATPSSSYFTQFGDVNIHRYRLMAMPSKGMVNLANQWNNAQLAGNGLHFLLQSTQGNPLLLQQLVRSTAFLDTSTNQFILARMHMLAVEEKSALSQLALLGVAFESQMLKYVDVSIDEVNDFINAGILTRKLSDKIEFAHLAIYEFVRNYALASNFVTEAQACLTRLKRGEQKDNLHELELSIRLELQLNQFEQAGETLYILCLKAQKSGFYEFALSSILMAWTKLQTTIPPELALKIRLMQLSLIKARFGWNSPQLALINRSIHHLCNNQKKTIWQPSILFNQWLQHLMSLNFEQSLTVAETLTTMAKKHNDQCAFQQGLVALSNSHFWLGNGGKSIAYAERAIAHYQVDYQQRELSDFGHDSRVFALLFLILNHSIKGDKENTDIYLNKLEQVTSELTPFALAISLQAKLFTYYHFDQPYQTIALAKQLKALAVSQNFPFYIGIANIFLGWAHGCLASPSDGLRSLEEGYTEWLAKSGERLSYSVYMCMRAELLLKLKRHQQAVEELTLTIEECRRNRELTYLSLLTYFQFKGKQSLMESVDSELDLLVEATKIAERQSAFALIDKFERHTIREENEKAKCR